MWKWFIAIFIFIALIVLLFNIKGFTGRTTETPEAVYQCIGEKSIIYTQEGCIHCIEQEKLFGEGWKYINEFDCTKNEIACFETGIQGTPTWIIDGKMYSKVLSIEELRKLTNC